jgi:hypothetical protein
MTDMQQRGDASPMSPGNRGSVSYFPLRLCLRFIVLAPICLVLWLLVMPAYAWFLGQVTMLILKYVFQYPIEYVTVANAALANMNMDTSLSYRMEGMARIMPDIGNLVANVAPYVALILATPKLHWLRRLRILGIGVVIIFAFHAATILLRFVAGRTSLPTAIGFIAITLPFLLWIVLAYWDKLLGYLGTDESIQERR